MAVSKEAIWKVKFIFKKKGEKKVQLQIVLEEQKEEKTNGENNEK